MAETILITGGAGFIGSHLADHLLEAGYAVRALDALEPQVHGEGRERPAYLDPRVELVVGDICDRRAVDRALVGVDAVVHLAAAVGVGQSMYEMARYTATNNLGTAVLLEALNAHPVRRLVVASSMSVYGEGRYISDDERVCDRVRRRRADLEAGRWEPRDPRGGELTPIPTPEDKPGDLASIYALSKFDQERMCLVAGEAYERPTVALRFFNTYGPRQALGNPYTGVLAIFAARLLNGQRPLVFEDGLQKRDFVSVHDVARACRLALEKPGIEGQVINIGTGEPRSILEIARMLAEILGRPDLRPEIVGRWRVGDIRHCFADIGRAHRLLGYRPRVSLAQGLAELGAWLADQEPVDRVDQARRELEERGLTV